jgi:TatD DNase family protein
VLGSMSTLSLSCSPKYVDIGANLLDPMFSGVYNGKERHPGDLSKVLERAFESGIDRLIVTSGSVEEATSALPFVSGEPRLFTTVGVHPTRCSVFETDEGATQVMAALHDLLERGGGDVVCIGEFGLDYDREHFCPRAIQLRGFEAQFELCKASGLPAFFHHRGNCTSDFLEICRRKGDCLKAGGVVHSFTGTEAQARELMDLGLYIGLNGCSLKTEDNLQVVKALPLDRLMLETDAPWCEIKRTHAGHGHVRTMWSSTKKERFVDGETVKGRCEPCHIVQVAEVVAGVKGLDVAEVAQHAYENSLKLFFPK